MRAVAFFAAAVFLLVCSLRAKQKPGPLLVVPNKIDGGGGSREVAGPGEATDEGMGGLHPVSERADRASPAVDCPAERLIRLHEGTL